MNLQLEDEKFKIKPNFIVFNNNSSLIIIVRLFTIMRSGNNTIISKTVINLKISVS